jgi:chemotaxis protein CheD
MSKSATKGPNSCYISQGQHAVGFAQGDVISTILGSCVATCLWDPIARIGGMNHFLLPDGSSEDGTVTRFGANSMEMLINAMIRQGGDRRNFRAKVFGGANLRAGLTDAGQQNAEFVIDYLTRENIPCDGQSLGGTHARRVEFLAEEGRARQKLVADQAVKETKRVVAPVEDESGLELF